MGENDAPIAPEAGKDGSPAHAKSRQEAEREALGEVGGARSTSSDMGTLPAIAIGLIGIGVWVVLGFGIAAIFSDWARAFWKDYWAWVLGAFVFLLTLYFVGQWVTAWRRNATREVARRALAQTVIPVIAVAIMGLVVFGEKSYWTLVAQLIVILVAALLPALVYFLFLASRRPSILNEYVANLGRLGLIDLREKSAESDTERRTRIESYFLRFEAIYGALRFDSTLTRRDFVGYLVDSKEGRPTGRDKPPQPSVSFGDLLHGNLIIPLGLVTILSTLGWMLVFQPSLVELTAAKAQGVPGAGVADLIPKLTAVNFAFLGAYFFGIQMLFRRFVRRDLGPNAYFAFANRIILAVIGVWLIVVGYDAFQEAPAQVAPVAATATASGVTASDAEKKAAPVAEAGKSKPAETASDKGEPATAAVPKAAELPGQSVAGPAAPPAGGSTKSEASKPEEAKKPAAAQSASREAPASADGAFAWISRFGTTLKSTLSEREVAAILLFAFAVGVFPRVVWQFLSAAATKVFFVKLALPSVEAQQPLNELDGLTVWHETRLEEEDVENVPNMASVDMVELMLHTQIPIERLVSWVDQAILQTALGPRTEERDGVRDKLRALGIRTATQLVAIATSSDSVAKGALEKRLPEGQLAALVIALSKEVNFDMVRAWRDVALAVPGGVAAALSGGVQQPPSAVAQP